MAEDDWRRRAPEFNPPRLGRNLALRDGCGRSPSATRPPSRRSRSRGPWPGRGVTGAIVGARTPEQVDGWIDAGSIELAGEDLAEIAGDTRAHRRRLRPGASEVSMGIHHVTAIAREPQRNLDFYAGTLGMRLVKLTINYDDPGTYHFYYGDALGRPGSLLTFFPWTGGRPGRQGTGQINGIGLAVPLVLPRLLDRAAHSHGVKYEGPTRRFDEPVLAFTDPDGLMIELIATARVDRHRRLARWAGPGPACGARRARRHDLGGRRRRVGRVPDGHHGLPGHGGGGEPAPLRIRTARARDRRGAAASTRVLAWLGRGRAPCTTWPSAPPTTRSSSRRQEEIRAPRRRRHRGA